MIPHAIEGTVAIFKELMERDAPVYAITNWNGDKFREARQRFPFVYEFRDIVVSGDENLIKPDPVTSNLRLGRNGLEAADCRSIEDNLKKVKGAEADRQEGASYFTLRRKLCRKILVEWGWELGLLLGGRRRRRGGGSLGGNFVTMETPAASNLSMFIRASIDCSRLMVLPMSFSGDSLPDWIMASMSP